MKDRMVQVNTTMKDMTESWKSFVEGVPTESRDKVVELLFESTPTDLAGLNKLLISLTREVFRGSVPPVVLSIAEPILAQLVANIHAMCQQTGNPELAKQEVFAALLEIRDARPIVPRFIEARRPDMIEATLPAPATADEPAR